MRHSAGRLHTIHTRLRTAAGATLAIIALVASGCASETNAVEENSVDLGKLDTGRYLTEPQPLNPKNPAWMARNMEALRLGNVMPLPHEIDPALVVGSGGVHPFVDVQAFDGSPAFGWLKTDDFEADTAGFVSGFATAGASDTDANIAYSLTDAVMVFDTEDAAAAAATALARSGFDTKESVEPASSIQHPTAQLLWIPTFQILASWFASGKYVIITIVRNGENSSLNVSDQASLVALSDKAITDTVDRLAKFQPTPQDKLASLPLDPDNMLQLALLRPPGDKTAYPFDGTLDRHGALHTVDDPSRMQSLFEKTGVDAVSFGAGELLRTRNSDAASTYIREASTSKFQRRIDSPSGLPSAQCFKYRGPILAEFAFNCYVTHGRYAAQVWSMQQQDAYQRISAQYAILANSK